MSSWELEIYHSTWAMERHHPEHPEWSLQQQCEMLVEAGFEGVNIDLVTPFIPPIEILDKTLRDWGLSNSICAFPATLDDVRHSLDQCVRLDATALVLNARIFPFEVGACVDFVGRSLDMGAESGIPVQFETHRFTLTNDLLFTCQLLDQVPQLELVADLSHYVVGREIPYPVDSFHQSLIGKILSRAASIQGRVASREQIQIPLHFPQSRKWVEQFYTWWAEGIRLWRERNPEGGRFNFTCELGPPEYAMTDARGYELSDRWQESLLLKDRVEQLWQVETGSDTSA